jgi:Acetyl-CoA hydrolase
VKNWREEYAERICTAKEAVSYIRTKDRVVVAHACAEPVILTDAMELPVMVIEKCEPDAVLLFLVDKKMWASTRKCFRTEW